MVRFVEMVPAHAWFLVCGAWRGGVGVGGGDGRAYTRNKRKTTDEVVDGVAAAAPPNSPKPWQHCCL